MSEGKNTRKWKQWTYIKLKLNKIQSLFNNLYSLWSLLQKNQENKVKRERERERSVKAK